MLNNFRYASDIPQSIRDRLIEREPLCEKAVADSSPLEWHRESDTRRRVLYVLHKCGLTNQRLATFSEMEVDSLPDSDFLDRVFGADVKQQSQNDKTYFEERITEWRLRLEALYSQVRGWTPPDWIVDPGQILQRQEEIMRRHGIVASSLPTLTLLRGKSRVSFVPSALWVIGADGRVNVTTNTAQCPLVDRRQNPSLPSDWVLVKGSRQDQMVKFDRHAMLTLLQEAM